MMMCFALSCSTSQQAARAPDAQISTISDMRPPLDMRTQDIGPTPPLNLDGSFADEGLASVDAFAVLINGEPTSPQAQIDFGQLAQHTSTSADFEIRNLGTVALRVVFEYGVGVQSLPVGDLSFDIAPGEAHTLSLKVSTDRVSELLNVPVSIDITGSSQQRLTYTLTATIEPYIRDAASANLPFKNALDSILNEAGLVGLAAAVVKGTEIVAIEGVGFADREAAISVDPRITRFRWASVAKSMGAVVALRHPELDIDASITEYFAEYEVPHTYLEAGCNQLECATELSLQDRRITLRQLLSHRAGIQHYTNGVINPTPPQIAVNDPRVNDGIQWAIEYFKLNPLVAIPGSAFKYSSFGYNLMGVVLEHALADNYEALVQAHVGEVLGMGTLTADRFWEVVPNRAVGYRFSRGIAIRDGNTDVSWKLPGGGFISTVVDLARYCGGLQSDVLLSGERREGVLWHDHFNQNYGLGFGVGTSGGRRLISHTGSQQKAASSLRLYPDEGMCIVVMSNTRPNSARTGYDSAGAIGRQVDSAWRLLDQNVEP
jgi:serine beta-lactamase-like protein LACTB, mitochondrial